jgi:hypothetical protein
VRIPLFLLKNVKKAPCSPLNSSNRKQFPASTAKAKAAGFFEKQKSSSNDKMRRWTTHIFFFETARWLDFA